ncbi:hypothetical protein [Arthrobacter crystallopoietes]|uniref:Alternate signal-mediated exported protein, RER_14450 family n=1 Tax=Crystallibacter crystallopoietes TaxID=37928 RepID=A0A1H0ZN29_9MICC|nr:hypothetical protein [Arthrobacter crystallopoietes]AUI51900.1 hypothetical protein AC20117_14990 [Arthrobacter crystallopoietes]SDQ28747.1 hypothetical protein SAMN04489742_0460 [Arthrobacter crystallopoietes]
MKKFTAHKKRVAITTAALVAIGGGAAFAYWTSTGSGTGSATTGTTVPFTVTSTTATGGPLTPGGPSQVVEFEVTNPSTGVQRLQNVIVTVADEDGILWTDAGGCSYKDYFVSDAVFTAGDVAPNGGKVTGTVTIKMNNLATNQDACKGLAVPLHFSAS